MNARQKTKKYKQQLGYLNKQIVKPNIVTQYPVKPVTICVTQRYNDELHIPKDMVIDDLMHQIAACEDFRDAVSICCAYDPISNVDIYAVHVTVLPKTVVHTEEYYKMNERSNRHIASIEVQNKEVMHE